MNKKGFTLIELLMVIVIIAILSAIMIPNIIVIINKNNENNLESLQKNIISSTKTYVNDNKYALNFGCPDDNTKEISLSTLITNGYLKDNIINPNTKEQYDINESSVSVTFDCINKTFSYSLDLK